MSLLIDNPSELERHLFDSLCQIDFDDHAASKWLKKSSLVHVQKKSAAFAIDRLASKRFRMSRSEAGRLYSTFTGMKRELRQFITIDDEHLAEVDVSGFSANAIALFVLRDHPNAFDAVEWQRVACRTEPDVYEHIANLCDFRMANGGIDRDRAKLALNAFWYAGWYRQTPDSQIVKQVMIHMYPTVAAWLRRNKQPVAGESAITAYKKTAKLLQSTERHIVIDCAAGDFVERTNGSPILTCHDALFCRESELPTLVESVRSSLRKANFPANFKTKPTAK
ncbi:hypothetical protein GC163_22725 [bacterium]|nr:hypothetical protein [bacterium]